MPSPLVLRVKYRVKEQTLNRTACEDVEVVKFGDNKNVTFAINIQNFNRTIVIRLFYNGIDIGKVPTLLRI